MIMIFIYKRVQSYPAVQVSNLVTTMFNNHFSLVQKNYLPL
jgi:hypothetical protein